MPSPNREYVLTTTQEPRRRTEGTSDVVFEQASDAIVVTDGSVIITGWNPAAEQTYGIPAADAIGRHLDAVLSARMLDGGSAAGLMTTTTGSNGRWRGG